MFVYCKNRLPREAIREVGREINESWALIMYWDRKIYFVRSVDRPLWVCDLREKGLGRFIVSTEEMFEKACKIAGEEFKKMPHFEPLPYRLYVVSADGKVEKVKDLDIDFPVVYDDYYVPYIWNYNDYDYSYDYGRWYGFSDYYEDSYFEDSREVKEELDRVEAEIEDIKEQISILENEFSDGPEQIYMTAEAEERLKELLKKRRKLKRILKKMKKTKSNYNGAGLRLHV